MVLEDKGAEPKFVGALIYEFIGTALLMYALMVNLGIPTAAIYIQFALMVVAWNVSGGHFNPCLTVAALVSNFNGKNLIFALAMIVGQFLGAMFGILLGYLALIAKDFKSLTPHGNVPYTWVGFVYPVGPDGAGKQLEWQTFWAILLTSIILSLGFLAIKRKETRLSQNCLIQAFAILALM